MSEESEQGVDNNQIEPLPTSRIVYTTAVVGVAGSAISAALVSLIFGLGFLFGGLLAVGNFLWLKRSVGSIFDDVAAGEKPVFTGSRYFGRYLTLGLILAVVYLVDFVPIVAVLAGLSSFAAAILIEGFFRIFNSFLSK
jgi:hypothetical protein